MNAGFEIMFSIREYMFVLYISRGVTMDSNSLLATPLNLMIKGGILMWPLLACAIIGLSIIILKIIQFRRIRLGQVAFVQAIIRAVARGHCRQAIEKLKENPHPAAYVLLEAINAGQDITLTEEYRDSQVSRVGALQIRNLKGYLRGLAIVANISPLIGLLGTVTGMIIAFAALEATGSKVDPGLLAGGIWEALIPTAFGLLIAIPALIAFYLLEGRIERTRSIMQDAAAEILEHLNQRYRHAREERLKVAKTATPVPDLGIADGSLMKA
jgi:biopolymer transport protein ExbB